MPAVSDSSPLIYLAALSDFHLLREIFSSIVIPEAVYREVVTQGASYPVKDEVEAALGDWLTVQPIRNPHLATQISREQQLQAGECEVIALAKETQFQPLLLDEQRAVTYARSLGLKVVRTPLIYTEAKLRGRIITVREKLDALRREDFWLKDRDYEAILKTAGEL